MLVADAYIGAQVHDARHTLGHLLRSAHPAGSSYGTARADSSPGAGAGQAGAVGPGAGGWRRGVVPPLSAGAHRYDWAEALQFMVLALVAPGLVVAGAPWRGPGAWPGRRSNWPPPASVTMNALRTVAVAVPALACMVAWRTPAAVNAVRSGGWLLALEAFSLGIAGAALWLECISSAALVPRSPRPQRIAVAAVSMWTIWVLAYLLAMSACRVVPQLPACPRPWDQPCHRPASGAPVSCGPWPPPVSSPLSSGTWCNGSTPKRTPTTSCTVWSAKSAAGPRHLTAP